LEDISGDAMFVHKCTVCNLSENADG
jgi:hypothetical protein